MLYTLLLGKLKRMFLNSLKHHTLTFIVKYMRINSEKWVKNPILIKYIKKMPILYIF